ncbi:MAG: serine/threonine protein kinase [Deltaproteobacteria bacterium]|nr:serine/threonine protein kinase [Deltaproteobacteria bacterium]
MPFEGEIIGDRYRLAGPIGKGGMSSVWAGVHLALDRPVAVKFLQVRGDEDYEALTAQFLREARIAAAVRHRNVVDVLDFGTTDQGTPFMVMEMLRGETLGARLVRSPPLAVNELMHIVNLTLRGLSVAHDAGIVHRDIKPENIFLQYDEAGVYPKIFDFGISRSLDLSGPRSALTTKEGFLVGTPHYMSPEQVRGIRDIDQRTDIYSMGVILYEALTGHLPFDAENIGDLVIAIVQANTPSVLELRPEVGPAISQVVSRAMHRERDERFANAREMQERLLKAVEQRFGSRGLTISVMPRPNRLSAPESSQARVEEKIKNYCFNKDLVKAISGNGGTDRASDPLATPHRDAQRLSATSMQTAESSTPFSWSMADRPSQMRPSWIRPSPKQLFVALIPAVLFSLVALSSFVMVDSSIDRAGPPGERRGSASVAERDKKKIDGAFPSRNESGRSLSAPKPGEAADEHGLTASEVTEALNHARLFEPAGEQSESQSVAFSTTSEVDDRTALTSHELTSTDRRPRLETNEHGKKPREPAGKRPKRRARRDLANKYKSAAEPQNEKIESKPAPSIEPAKRRLFRDLDY